MDVAKNKPWTKKNKDSAMHYSMNGGKILLLKVCIFQKCLSFFNSSWTETIFDFY